MLTPWGDLPLADAHVHFFSHRFFALLAQQKQTDLDAIFGILGWERPAEDPAQLAHTWLHELDRHGVAKAMLIASLPQDAESVAAAVRVAPDRLKGAAMVNPLTPIALPPEITMACLFPAMHGYRLDHEAVRSLIDSLPVQTRYFVHCGTLSVGIRGKLGLPSNFPVQNPLDLEPLARAYPKTRFLVPHFGSGLWKETLTLARQCENVYLDSSSSNSWIVPPASLAAVFDGTLKAVGSHRLLFGTDSSFFPRGWNKAVVNTQIQALQQIGADAALARRMFVDNFDAFCEM